MTVDRRRVPLVGLAGRGIADVVWPVLAAGLAWLVALAGCALAVFI
jgi:hypothetical protein